MLEGGIRIDWPGSRLLRDRYRFLAAPTAARAGMGPTPLAMPALRAIVARPKRDMREILLRPAEKYAQTRAPRSTTPHIPRPRGRWGRPRRPTRRTTTGQLRATASDSIGIQSPEFTPTRQWNRPTVAPVRHVASVPASMDFSPSSTTSRRRWGIIDPMPPIMIPRLPKFANPHSA
jgi:hypothetical protein